MNKADNEAGNAAIDSLLNYETVKVGHMINCTYIETFAACLSFELCFLATNAKLWKPICATE